MISMGHFPMEKTMKKTVSEGIEAGINKLAAEAMGMCWHEMDVKLGFINGCPHCVKCGEHYHSNTDDFVNDLNAAQRLFDSVRTSIRRDDLLGRVYSLIGVDDGTNEIFKIIDLIVIPAKTRTLAALFSLDLITLEEAKEILK